jgi:23S rRNA (uracil-5-)-methyltransferase RumA
MGRRRFKKKKKKLIDEIAENYRNSPVTPKCPHFGKCGGCSYQDISYENQLELKKEYLNRLMEGRAVVEDIVPSSPFRYRNRMDLVTAFGKIGLREAGQYRFVTDIHSCKIMQERSDTLLKELRPDILDIEGYNYLSHKGYLRYAVFRETMFTKQLMINFVVADREKRPDPVLERASERADSVSILFNDGLADVSFGEISETIKTGHIEESLDEIRFRITPNSFFQSNSEITLKVYREIRNEAEGNVLDLYSGVGSISLFTAPGAERVTGVESVAEAVETARTNSEINSAENVEFICADAREYMRETDKKYHTLILDPPRSGMHPKMIKHIEEMAPGKIIYMSCNPVHFKNELELLENYSLESFRAYDMFPQTPHIETLAILRRK